MQRKLKLKEIYKFYGDNKIEERVFKEYDFEEFYVDSNDFLHNLEGPAMIEYLFTYDNYYYFIHGKEYKTKRDWEIEVNRINTLKEI